MDTSETNIKMCEKAEEIQGAKWLSKKGSRCPWEDGDMIALEIEVGNYKVFMYDGCSHSEGFIEPEVYSTRCIWLPRQDQLQEMVKAYPDGSGQSLDGSLLLQLAHWYADQDGYYPWHGLQGFHFASMEQLWLALVMKEKYNKIWDGTNWIK